MSAPTTVPPPGPDAEPKEHRRVLTGTLFRKPSSPVTFTADAPPPRPEPVRRPANVARMLALAHHIQSAIDRGVVADRAAVARKLGFTRARITQLLDLLLLAPDIQARVLELEAVDGVEPMSERGLRSLVRAKTWKEQTGATRPFADVEPKENSAATAPTAPQHTGDSSLSRRRGWPTMGGGAEAYRRGIRSPEA
jgi:hypothetical protein